MFAVASYRDTTVCSGEQVKLVSFSRHSWCTLNDGVFIHLAVDRFLSELLIKEEGKKDNSEIPREDIEYDLDQCFHCLYGVTKSKSRYLQHHNAKTVIFALLYIPGSL